MKKSLVKFFLLLCVSLLSGYAHLYAHTCQDGIRPSSLKILERSEHPGFSTVLNEQAFINKPAPSGTEKAKYTIDATVSEEEDCESISFKKHVEGSHYFTAVFYALIFGHFIHERLPSCKHALYFSSHKWYLIFRMIRI